MRHRYIYISTCGLIGLRQGDITPPVLLWVYGTLLFPFIIFRRPLHSFGTFTGGLYRWLRERLRFPSRSGGAFLFNLNPVWIQDSDVTTRR